MAARPATATRATPSPHTESTGTETVVVACKVPNGLILANYNMVDCDIMLPGGGKTTTKRAERNGEPITVKGPGRKFNEPPSTVDANGYALTRGVDASFWDAWLEANKTSAYVVNKQIFAYEREDDTRAVTAENKDRKSGLEPIGTATDDKGRPLDQRIPKKLHGVGAVEAFNAKN